MESKKSKLEQYKGEYSKWLKELQPYFTRFNENYKRYTAVNETVGTDAKITDPVAPELVERVIQKLFQRDPKFYAESRGNSLPREVKKVLGAAAEYLWTNADTVQNTGTMRSKLKVAGREFCVTGNLAGEVFWNFKSDSPDLRIIPIEDVIFNPAKTLKNSDKYYLRQYVSLQYLKDNVEIKKDGTVVTGLFSPSAIKKLDLRLDDSVQTTESRDIDRSGSNKTKNLEQILMITRYDGKDVCRFVWEDDDAEPLLVQEYTNEILETHPLVFAMDIEVPKEPYAFSILDYLGGLLRAKDMFLNQLVDYGSKVLNPPLFIDPSIAPVHLKTVANAWKLGGVVLAPPGQAEHKTMPALGNAPYQMLDYIEQRAESVSGIGAYLAGVPNQTSDKTNGTKGGIEALINQSSSPVADRQINIEESFIEPAVNKMLKMIVATMGQNEFKWIMLSGQDAKAVRVTKGLMGGQIKLVDLMSAGIIKEDNINPETGLNEVEEMVGSMIDEGQDPQKDVVFDADWVIRVETGSLAEADTQKDVENKKMIIETGLGMGLNLDVEKLWKDLALDAGMEEPEQYLMQGGMNGIPGQNPGVPGQEGAPIAPTAQPNGAVPAMAGNGMQATPQPVGAGFGGLR